MMHQGSCHCGNVAFDVEGDIEEVMECNCSICSRKGTLMWFVPISALTLQTPEENSKPYTFGSGVIKHRFCTNCGVHPYGEGVSPSGEAMAAVNVRCLDHVDLNQIPRQFFNGRDV